MAKPLTGEELRIWNEIVKDPANLDIQLPFHAQKVQKVILETIEAAKDEFSAEFAGYYPAGNQLGIADLRPHHIGGSATWRKLYTNAGWQDWLADKAISDDIYVVMYELENIEPNPNTTALYIKAGVQTIPIIDLTPLKTRNRIVLKEPIVLGPSTTWDSDVRVETANAYDGLRPVGVVIGKGNVLIKKAYY